MADSAKETAPWETAPPAKAESAPWETEAPPAMDAIDAASIKGQEGALLGLRPVVAGIGAAAGNVAGQIGNGRPMQWTGPDGMTGAFSQGRQGAIDEQKKAQEDHPYISTAANIGGSLLTAPLMAAPETLLGAAKMGVGFGAAQAAGTANSAGEAVNDLGIGMVGGAAGYGLAKGAQATVGGGLQSLGETKAFKSAGAMLKDFRSAFNNDPNKINELGRTMLDEGLVKAGDSVKSIATKSELLRRETGQQIGKVYDKVLEELTSHESQLPPETIMQIQDAGFHPEAQAEGLKQSLAQKFKGVPGSTGALSKANTVIDELAANGNNITPDHALELKGHVDAMINWSKKSADLPLEQDVLKDVRGFIQERLNNQVDLMDQVLGSNQTKELSRLNKLYGNVSTISNVAKDRVLRESANQSFGLGEKMGGGIGAVVGLGAEMAMEGGGHGMIPLALGGAGMLANKAARTYGNAAVASGADALARGVSNPNNYAAPIANNMRPAMSTTIKTRDNLKKRMDLAN